MSRVVIYTKNNCPYCVKAKALLNGKDVLYEEINAEHDDKLREELALKSNGATSLPQIFVDDHRIGGCDDLYKLYESDYKKFNEIFEL